MVWRSLVRGAGSALEAKGISRSGKGPDATQTQSGRSWLLANGLRVLRGGV